MSGDNKNIIVIGTGSIGQRHARLLSDLGYIVYFVSESSNSLFPDAYNYINESLLRVNPCAAIIANVTSLHFSALQKLILEEYQGNILIEKPLCNTMLEAEMLDNISSKFSIFVAYQLRFHPIFLKLNDTLSLEKIYSVQVHVGQYLPSWRARDYKDSYSAQKVFGGGVLRDLSHELDLVLNLFGQWVRVVAITKKISDLEIDVEDTVAILLECERAPIISIEMNYTNRKPKRTMHISTNKNSYFVDLVDNVFYAGEQKIEYTVEKDDLFKNMHQKFLTNDSETLCSLSEGISVVKLIHAIEKSQYTESWVYYE